MTFNTFIFFENLSRKFNFHSNLTVICGTTDEDQNIFVIIPRPFLRTRNISDKAVEKITAHYIFSNFLFENRAVNEIMWKKQFVEPDMIQMAM